MQATACLLSPTPYNATAAFPDLLDDRRATSRWNPELNELRKRDRSPTRGFMLPRLAEDLAFSTDASQVTRFEVYWTKWMITSLFMTYDDPVAIISRRLMSTVDCAPCRPRPWTCCHRIRSGKAPGACLSGTSLMMEWITGHYCNSE